MAFSWILTLHDFSLKTQNYNKQWNKQDQRKALLGSFEMNFSRFHPVSKIRIIINEKCRTRGKACWLTFSWIVIRRTATTDLKVTSTTYCKYSTRENYVMDSRTSAFISVSHPGPPYITTKSSIIVIHSNGHAQGFYAQRTIFKRLQVKYSFTTSLTCLSFSSRSQRSVSLRASSS